MKQLLFPMGRHSREYNPMSNNNEFSYPGQRYEYDDPKPTSRQSPIHKFCTCRYSPVNTATIDPPDIVKVDPDCPFHGEVALRGEYLVTCEVCGTVWNYYENPPIKGMCVDCAYDESKKHED